ncbi:MAG: T9SS type A sorting domain-containing protein [Bacteroidota bacterium]|nr:T9SS type A sorting domain-containing protein [Bacteroidota bacterium]
MGQLVKILVSENQQAGRYEINFNANGLSSGIYYYKLIFENTLLTKKFLLLK